MKKRVKYVAAILAICLNLNCIYGNTFEVVPIQLERHNPIGNTDKPSKAPVKNLISLSVEYDEENHTLYFCDDNSNTIEYSILNSDSDCILQGTCNFDANGHYSVLVPTTQNGIYTIYITVNNTLYKGEFTITE